MLNSISINALMRHLRNRHNINIQGSTQKRKLRNIGYYHGYKGYRYIKKPTNKIAFTNFNEIIAMNEFDTNLKSIFYPHIMFIETALKNYILEEVLLSVKTNSFEDIYRSSLTQYKNYSSNHKSYTTEYIKRLQLRDKIYGTISFYYTEKRQIVKHFYHKDIILPIWSIFEIISMGVFGTFVSCLDNSIKKSISESLKLNQSFDSDRKLTQGIIFLLKGLRNSIAHNDVIYDTRFQTSKPSRALKRCLEADTGISDISFNTIVDYFILVIYMLKCFDVTKTELKKIVKSFELGINSFRQKIPISIYSSIFYSDTRNKLNLLKAFV